jgi:hypothetical protein
MNLSKHDATAGILTPALQQMFVCEILLDGAEGARRFIEGLPRP